MNKFVGKVPTGGIAFVVLLLMFLSSCAGAIHQSNEPEDINTQAISATSFQFDESARARIDSVLNPPQKIGGIIEIGIIRPLFPGIRRYFFDSGELAVKGFGTDKLSNDELWEYSADSSGQFKVENYCISGETTNEVFEDGNDLPVELSCNSPWREYLRKGEWQYWYKSGQPRAKMTYAISKGFSCCPEDYCNDFYEYKRGPFSYWYPNGQLLTEGEFVNIKLSVSSCCEGGSSSLVTKIPDSVKFFDVSGNVIQDADKLTELRKMVLDL